MGDIHFGIYGRKMPWSLIRYEVHLTDSCNLHCAGCLHFSSLCDRSGADNLLDINSYENDCKRISELSNGRMVTIRLLGGEPLLHPNVNSFITITRKYFPELNKTEETGIIDLITNGILLHKQSDEFWNICCKNNARIIISEYPVELKTEIIKEKSKQFNVEVKMNSEKIHFHETGSADHWVKIPIDIDGMQNNMKSFGKCPLAGNCFQLVKGKIYKCARIAYIDYFNASFSTQLKIDENDYVDIYKVNDIREILYLLTKPASFCRYCKVNNTTWDNEWKVSKGKMDEWI
jgi:ABC-2 type transport system ATP-binding protein